MIAARLGFIKQLLTANGRGLRADGPPNKPLLDPGPEPTVKPPPLVGWSFCAGIGITILGRAWTAATENAVVVPARRATLAQVQVFAKNAAADGRIQAKEAE